MRGASAKGTDVSGERLAKIMASAGIASRRACEELISEGRVEVDGEVILDLGRRVDRMTQQIYVDGERLPRPQLLYFAVHKPTGIVCTANDPSGRPRVIDLLPPNTPRVFNVGRLDMHSEGLILVTNDGELANRLTHPRHGVEKTYQVHVAGVPDREVLAQLRKGIYLAEGFSRVENVRVKSRRRGMSVLEMVLKEGRNREIRRLLARVGHKVQRLVRVAVGPIRLGELPSGAVRPLTEKEVAKLRESTDSSPRRKPRREAKAGGQSGKRGDTRDVDSGRKREASGRTLIGAKSDQEPIGERASVRKKRKQMRTKSASAGGKGKKGGVAPGKVKGRGGRSASQASNMPRSRKSH